MRQIKFRYYDPSIKAMLSPDYIGEYGFYATGRDVEDGISMPLDRLMQFTGLKDHKGNDIYDGDILADRKSTWTVSWNDNHACFQVTNREHPSVVAEVIDNQNMTVVGNIYESVGA